MIDVNRKRSFPSTYFSFVYLVFLAMKLTLGELALVASFQADRLGSHATNVENVVWASLRLL